MPQQGQGCIAELVLRGDVAADQQQDALRGDLFGCQLSVCLPLEEQTHQVVARLAAPLFQQVEKVALQVDGGLTCGAGDLRGVADRAAEEARELHGPPMKRLAILGRDAEQVRDHDRRQRPARSPIRSMRPVGMTASISSSTTRSTLGSQRCNPDSVKARLPSARSRWWSWPSFTNIIPEVIRI